MDPFNYDSSVFNIFSKFFSGVDLELRLAWIMNQLNKGNIKKEELNGKSQDQLKKYMRGFSHEEMLRKWYEHYFKEEPPRSIIKKTLEEYQGCEGSLWLDLYRRYIDASMVEGKLPFETCSVISSTPLVEEYFLTNYTTEYLYLVKNGRSESRYYSNIMKKENISLNFLSLYYALGLKFEFFFDSRDGRERLGIIILSDFKMEAATKLLKGEYKNEADVLSRPPIFKMPEGLKIKYNKTKMLENQNPITISNILRLSNSRGEDGDVTMGEIRVLNEIVEDLTKSAKQTNLFRKMQLIKELKGAIHPEDYIY